MQLARVLAPEWGHESVLLAAREHLRTGCLQEKIAAQR